MGTLGYQIESYLTLLIMFAVDKTINRIGDSCGANQLRVRMIPDHKNSGGDIHGLDRRASSIAQKTMG